MTGWLSLKITDQTAKQSLTGLALLRISVPKKVIPLATQRNRIKRLIREVIRKKPVLKNPDKIYCFKVMRKKEDIDFRAASEAIDSLIG